MVCVHVLNIHLIVASNTCTVVQGPSKETLSMTNWTALMNSLWFPITCITSRLPARTCGYKIYYYNTYMYMYMYRHTINNYKLFSHTGDMSTWVRFPLKSRNFFHERIFRLVHIIVTAYKSLITSHTSHLHVHACQCVLCLHVHACQCVLCH